MKKAFLSYDNRIIKLQKSCLIIKIICDGNELREKRENKNQEKKKNLFFRFTEEKRFSQILVYFLVRDVFSCSVKFRVLSLISVNLAVSKLKKTEFPQHENKIQILVCCNFFSHRSQVSQFRKFS